jgi:dUTP pyrophosphatase
MSYHLKICINDQSCGLESVYKEAVEEFKNHIGDSHRDSGFDLFVPTELTCPEQITTKINHKVSCAVYRYDHLSLRTSPSGYYMYPRSSISKTPLRLANSVGIIDSGYRGDLIAKVDNINGCSCDNESGDSGDSGDSVDYVVGQHSRLFQVCAPDLSPFASVEIVDSLDDTTRGAGGFGSTGV